MDDFYSNLALKAPKDHDITRSQETYFTLKKDSDLCICTWFSNMEKDYALLYPSFNYVKPEYLSM